jgi:hypothetical protein
MTCGFYLQGASLGWAQSPIIHWKELVMKRTYPWISLLLAVLLVGCNMVSPSSQTPVGGAGGLGLTPTLSDVEMQTQIALLLTAMPTSTSMPDQPTATEALPTLTQAAANAQPTSTETPAVTLAPAEPQPTATSQPAPAETTAPTATVMFTPAPAATATLQPVPSFTAPAGDPRSRLGSPTSSDPMDNALAWVWPTGSDEFTVADFSNGSMALTAINEVDGWRLANPRGVAYGNLYLEASFRTETCAKSDHYGLIMRVPVIKEADQGYLFGVTCDGLYSLRRWDGKIGKNGQMDWLVRWTASPAIATGSNQANRLGMMTVGNRLILYVNGTLLTEVQDNTFATGYFGVFVGSDETNRLTVRVEEMAYWENPQP